MSYYVGLDVSVKSVSICVVEADGAVIARGNEAEIRIIQQMHDIPQSPCLEIVQAKNLVVLRNKSVAKVRTDEAGTTGHENFFCSGRH